MKEALHYMLRLRGLSIGKQPLVCNFKVKMTLQPSMPTRTLLSVTELNQQARVCLETKFMSVWVKGELSNFSAPTSGHWYFTLKDAGAQIKGAMFRAKNARLNFTPKQGDEVIVRGRVSLYEGRGDYQLIVDDIEPIGAGKLQLAFDQLKTKMRDMGWFDDERKKPIPDKPAHIAVITSPTGAALQDMLSVAKRRYPLMRVTVLSAAVQGDLAAPELSDRLRQANSMAEQPDLIIIGRGGGSLEDLWAFNEPQVARAILDSTIPVISAVGHETDFSISDFVADLRAPTPSAAIELATPDIVEMHQNLVSLAKQLLALQRQRLERLNQAVDLMASRLKHPAAQLQTQQAQLATLKQRLASAGNATLMQQRRTAQQLSARLDNQHPSHRLAALRASLTQLAPRLERAGNQVTVDYRQKLARLADLLQANSPLNTLARGFSVVKNTEGQIVKTADQLDAGDRISIQFSKGEATARVE